MNIFISHNSADKELAAELVKLIQFGMGIEKSNIFCSSVDGTQVPIGSDFQAYIKSKLKDSKLVLLALITKNYYHSTFSMYELGAAWANSTLIIPILVGVEYSDLRYFLVDIIAVKANNPRDINRLKDTLSQNISTVTNTNSWEEQRDLFIKNINNYKGSTSVTFPPSLVLKPSQNRYKLVAFDLDGTLLQGKDFKYSWKAVWQYLGYDDSLRHDLLDKHMKNPSGYTYEQWCKDCVYHFTQKGLKRNQIREIIKSNKIKQAPTLESTLKVLKQQGIVIAVISGGIDTFYEFGISKNVQKLIDRVYINRFTYDHDELLNGVAPEGGMESDFFGKVKILENMCAELNCNVDETVFVGEGLNDKEIGNSACLSIAYPCNRAHPEFLRVANRKIYEKSISAILPYILVGN